MALLPSSSYTPPASATVLGKIKLTGDLGGTANTPLIKRTTRFIVAPYGDTRPADYTCASPTGNQIEINQAIVAANALTNGGVVDLLDGSFTVSASIVPLNNVWIRGQGMFATKIGITSSANTNIFGNRSVYSGSNPWTKGIISDLEIDGSGLDTSSTVGKGIDGVGSVDCKITRLYVHDTVATGIGFDDYQSGTVTECIVQNCGYNNKRIISAASWSASTFTFTTTISHGYSAGVQATGTLTSTGIVNDGDIVVIAAKTYTFKTTLSGAAYEVAINGSAANALSNLKLAVNLTGTAGVNYGLNTFKNPSVTAGTLTSTTLALTAISFGTSGNSLATTTTGANLSFGSSTLTGGITGDRIVVAGMTPAAYNGVYNITSVTSATTFTIGTSNNSGLLNIASDPGTATVFGTTSDFLIGHNGIGIASGAMTVESMVITNNFCISNQNNNYLIEVNAQNTGQNASYIFSNNYSMTAGNCGYRNTGSLNTQFNNNFDYGSLVGCVISPSTSSKTITNASWSGGVATYTTSSAHGFPVGAKVTIDHITPTGFNGFYTIQSAPTTTTFTVNITSDPGAILDIDIATAVWNKDPTDGTQIINNIFSANQSYGIQSTSQGNNMLIKNNIIKSGAGYGMNLSNPSYIQIVGNEIYSNGRQGIYISSSSYTQAEHIIVSQNTVYNNGTRVANTYDGIELDPGTTAPLAHITLQDNHVFDDQDTKTQRYGVLLRSGGLLTYVMLSNNELVGNLTAGVLIQNTSDTIWIVNNPGVNPIGKSSLGSISGAVTFDTTLANYFTATLTGNITATMPASIVQGTTMTWILQQGGSGGNTITLPGNTNSGNGLVLSTALNAVDIITWIYDLGTTKWRILSSNIATGNQLSLVTKGANYTLTDADDIVKFNASGKILTFHDATIAKKKRYTIKNSSSGSMTFATTSSQTVDGSTTGTIVSNQAIEAVPDGANWIIT